MELYELFFKYFIASLIASVFIGILCGLATFWNRIYSARVKHIGWILLMLYLIIPVSLPKTQPALQVNLLEKQGIVIQNVLSEQEYVLYSTGTSGQTNEADRTEELPPKRVSKRSYNVWQIIATVWLTGCVVFFSYEMLCYLLYRKHVLRWSKYVKSDEIDSLQKDIAQEYKISGELSVKVTENVNSPMLIGFFKPYILLPHMDYGKSELETIIRHEMLHYKRKDLWCKVLFTATKSVHWFNPLVYVMCKHANADLERACDDCALTGKSLEQRKEYAETILSTVKRQKGNVWSSCFYGGKSMLKQRFENILYTKKKKSRSVVFAMFLTLLVGVNSLVACNIIPAIQEKEQNKHSEEEILEFAKKFVNEFQGTISKTADIKLEDYIANENLLTFAQRMIELTQKQTSVGASMVLYGEDNEFYDEECTELQEGIWYVNLLFEYEGSGFRCQLLVEDMVVQDFYFGTMDGVDTISTGHLSQRTVDNPDLWEDEQWVLSVYEKMIEYEGMLDAMGM